MKTLKIEDQNCAEKLAAVTDTPLHVSGTARWDSEALPRTSGGLIRAS
jgi:hypothetical protein